MRHGQTSWSAEGRHTGRTDVPLTPVGRREAAELAVRLRAIEPALVLSSPLQRARETMKLAGYEGELDGDLVEWDYGMYEGRTTGDIRRETPGWSVWTHPVVGGESVEQVGARADAVLERIAHGSGTVLIFSHAHLLRILAARRLGLAARDGRLLALDTATVSELSSEHGSPVLSRWNLPCAAARDLTP